MKFGKNLHEEAREEWKDKYIDYMALKKKLWEVRDEVDNPHGNPLVLEAKRAIFQGYLDSEIEKVVLWYKSSLDNLKTNVKTLERDLALAPQILSDQTIETDFKLKGISTLRGRWRTVGTELACLLEYVSLNMIAMRKILKKYAKHVEPTKPMEGYCTLEIQHPEDPSWAFVQGTFLPDYVAKELDLMQNDPAVTDIQERTNVALGYLQMIRKQLLAKAHEEGVDRNKVSVAIPPLFPSGRYTEKQASLTRQQTIGHTSSDEQNILRQIEIAANHARVTARLVRSRPWSVAQAGIFEEPPGDASAVGNEAGLWITLAMSFLHACMYYLPTPTLSHLCKTLDVDLALGGLVFAIADVGEIIASFVYTFWTNTNYRRPLIFSACTGVLGCLLTSLAFLLPAGGFTFMLAGRFLIGAASARTICRRYIADCIPIATRTKASLGIVVASSAGMAVGSLVSVPIMHLGEVYAINVDLEPIGISGFIGGILWAATLVSAFFFFAEPHVSRRRTQTADDELQVSLLEGGHRPVDRSASLLTRRHMLEQTSWAAPHGEHDSGSDEWIADESIEPASKKFDMRRSLQRLLGSINVPWDQFREALLPTLCCFVCLSLFKLTVAVFSSSLPLFSHGTLWYWKDANRAIVLGGLGFTMLPSGYFASVMSARFSDRRILALSLAVTVAACIPLYQLGPSRLEKSLYLFGAIVLHMSVVGVEGTSMSLLSKVIHPSMARGPVNCGLLTTVAGTVGRLVGNTLVILLAGIVTVDEDSPEFELVTFATSSTGRCRSFSASASFMCSACTSGCSDARGAGPSVPESPPAALLL
eukprot:CAMPEP_0177603610 /NCGR_PEP_ID=MMETSP0419_2-20121207/15613_1 /TAXON_ID=582737 /ORGANISM="Tetraselmis sp., Strain GSL018" /LENGTH=815 /DNA_ID=CAMNT_0019097411 /DNA_START=392 /DNA_END=2840 /DNA_ORIENTATION=+